MVAGAVMSIGVLPAGPVVTKASGLDTTGGMLNTMIHIPPGVLSSGNIYTP